MHLSFLEIRQGLPVQSISRGLQELSVYYSNRMSYREVAGLVERQCGKRVLSEQTIWQLVQQIALALNRQVEWEIKPKLVTDFSLAIAQEIDVYDAETQEVLLFDDAISVKAQKTERQSDVEEAPENPKLASTSRILTDVVVLQTALGQYEYVSAPIYSDGSLSLTLAQVVQAKVQQVYGKRSQPLPLVVISDGASSIRKQWRQAFGDSVVIILDWYHVDQVIGHRQKHKGTSWRPQGSRALGLLKVLELNGQWQQFWFSQQLV